MIVTQRLPKNCKTVVRFGRQYVELLPKYETVVFINHTSLSKEQLEELFGEVRVSQIDTLYIPYQVHQIVVTEGLIGVWGINSWGDSRLITVSELDKINNN